MIIGYFGRGETCLSGLVTDLEVRKNNSEFGSHYLYPNVIPTPKTSQPCPGNRHLRAGVHVCTRISKLKGIIRNASQGNRIQSPKKSIRPLRTCLLHFFIVFFVPPSAPNVKARERRTLDGRPPPPIAPPPSSVGLVGTKGDATVVFAGEPDVARSIEAEIVESLKIQNFASLAGEVLPLPCLELESLESGGGSLVVEKGDGRRG